MSLIQQIKCATTDSERQAAQAALDAHAKSYGDAKTRKFIYRVEVLGKAYQIEVGSAKKFMTAEVRNQHRRLNKVMGNV
mgnify:CR=1 FL=1